MPPQQNWRKRSMSNPIFWNPEFLVTSPDSILVRTFHLSLASDSEGLHANGSCNTWIFLSGLPMFAISATKNHQVWGLPKLQQLPVKFNSWANFNLEVNQSLQKGWKLFPACLFALPSFQIWPSHTTSFNFIWHFLLLHCQSSPCQGAEGCSDDPSGKHATKKHRKEYKTVLLPSQICYQY